jgi:hypothetical protein
MLFMVIENFKNGDAVAVGRRFKQHGRMLPEGLSYQASWVDSARMRCFQIMETQDRELLKAWTQPWDDLVDFEIIPVESSAEFWARVRLE